MSNGTSSFYEDVGFVEIASYESRHTHSCCICGGIEDCFDIDCTSRSIVCTHCTLTSSEVSND